MDDSKECSTVDCVTRPGSEGVFVYVLIVRLVHFIYIVFYTYYSVESSEYIENALYFSISQIIVTNQVSVVHTFSFRTKDS